MTEELIERLRDRASSYRLGGPSSEHTAALLDEAADRLTVQLSGPPEPSDEEVLAAWFNVEPERLLGPKHRSEIASVQRVQALYRSRRA